MHIRYFVLFTAILSFISCKNQDKNNEVVPSSADSLLITKKTSLSDPYSYTMLEGTIAGKSVIMHLLRNNDQIDANYYYTEQGQTIFLFKNWEKENLDSIYLMENTDDGSGLSPQISLHIDKDSVSGIWESANGNTVYPIHLKESNAHLSLQFSAINYTDSAAYLGFITDTPMLRSSITLLMAKDNNASANWFNNTFKKLLDKGNRKYASLNLLQTAQAIIKEAKDNYNADVDSSLVGVETDSKNTTHYFLNREYLTKSNIIYNSNNYVVLSIFNYAYTGGAHGNYATSMHCLDIQNQKKLTLGDIITIDSIVLQHLLEKYYRVQYHIPEKTPLSARLFANNLEANNNFYFSPKGLGFIYTPYEIAPYAEGEINIWIPFSELQPYLTPEFATRMKL